MSGGVFELLHQIHQLVQRGDSSNILFSSSAIFRAREYWTKKDILDENGSGLEPEMLKECRYPEMTDQLTLDIPILRQYILLVVV